MVGEMKPKHVGRQGSDSDDHEPVAMRAGRLRTKCENGEGP